MRVPRSFLVLRHRDARLVVAGNVVSTLGMWAQYVGVGWAASQLTDSSVLVTLAFAAPWAPALPLSPVAGVLADRFDRRRLVMIGNAAMAVPPFAIGLMLQAGTATIWWLLGLVFLGGVGFALTGPASQALVPDLVEADEVQQAIALNSGAMNLTRILGPGIGGLAIHAWGVGWAFHLNAVSFFAVVAAWALVRVRPPLPVRTAGERFLVRLRAGHDYARRTPVVGNLLVLATAVGFFVMHAPLMPLIARDVLHGDEGTYALLSSAPGFGSIVGTLVAGEVVSGRIRRRALAASTLAIGALIVVFGASRTVWLSVGVLTLYGVVFFLVNTLCAAVVTAASDDEFRGRVLGLLTTAQLGLIPLNALVAGALSSLFGPAWTVVLAGTGFLVFSLAFVLTGRLRPVEAAQT